MKTGSHTRFDVRAQLLALLCIVLAAYLPAVCTTLNSVDDVHIAAAYGGVDSTITLKEILLPGHGFYYRPLVGLSYYLNALLWGMTPLSLHLENVLLHALNTVLVFLLARQVGMPAPDGGGVAPAAGPGHLVPFFSALLFALHPVNCEAVAWVAGRTDPLAASFVLGSAICLVSAVNRRDRSCLVPALILALLGVLAKEVAVAFLPAALVIAASGAPKGAGWRLSLRPVLALGVAVAGIFFAHRALNHASSGIDTLLKAKGISLAQAPVVLLKTWGFYAKKLFFPFPLNFAINEVPDYCLWFGVFASAGLGLVVLRRRDRYCALLIAAFLHLLPVFPVALLKIAWTPVAERYLYLPSAFFSVALVGLWSRWAAQSGRSAWGSAALACLLLGAFLVTGSRTLVWRDNLALYRDAVEKSPRFGAIRNELAVALIADGRSDEGARQLEIGRSLGVDRNTLKVMECNLLLERIKGKAPEEARALLLDFAGDKGKADLRVLALLRDAEVRCLQRTSDGAGRETLTRELIETNNRLYAKNQDPACLYNNGQLALAIADRGGAAAFFQKAHDAAPAGAFYKEAAGRLAFKLGKP